MFACNVGRRPGGGAAHGAGCWLCVCVHWVCLGELNKCVCVGGGKHAVILFYVKAGLGLLASLLCLALLDTIGPPWSAALLVLASRARTHAAAVSMGGML